jgi:hypothetical protein
VVDIFDEVDEELRAERVQSLLKRYGGLIIAAALAVIAGAAGWQAWHWWQAKQDMVAAQHYLTAMTMADAAAAAGPANTKVSVAAFDALTRAGPDGYRTLARLQAAAQKAEAGNKEGAAALWNDVASDTAADPLLRDLASLLWCQNQIDSGDPGLLTSRLTALAGPNNAWRPLAKEQLALLDLRQGKTDAAKTTLRALMQEPTTPAGVRERVASLLERLG